MKKITVIKRMILTLGFAFALLATPVFNSAMTANAAGSSVKIDAKHFPDRAFREYVTTYDKNNNGSFSREERLDIDELYVMSTNIKTLKGIEYFTNLKILICSGNQLRSLNVSKNTKLTNLSCFNNRLSSLDVSKNTKLKELYCYTNQLKSLNVSKNTKLKNLNCSDNQLGSLDVSGNTKLEELCCDQNQLSSLDVSKNTKLWNLDCDNNVQVIGYKQSK